MMLPLYVNLSALPLMSKQIGPAFNLLVDCIIATFYFSVNIFYVSVIFGISHSPFGQHLLRQKYCAHEGNNPYGPFMRTTIPMDLS